MQSGYLRVHPGDSYGMRSAFLRRQFLFADSSLKQEKSSRQPIFDDAFRDNWIYAFDKTISDHMHYGAKWYHLHGGEAVNLMMHAVTDEHGAPLPGALKVPRFFLLPREWGHGREFGQEHQGLLRSQSD